MTTMPLLRARELRYVVDKARVSVALCDARFDAPLRDATQAAMAADQTLQIAITCFNNLDDDQSVEALSVGKPIDFDNVKTASDDLAMIAFTSGTTGTAKTGLDPRSVRSPNVRSGTAKTDLSSRSVRSPNVRKGVATLQSKARSRRSAWIARGPVTVVKGPANRMTTASENMLGTGDSMDMMTRNLNPFLVERTAVPVNVTVLPVPT